VRPVPAIEATKPYAVPRAGAPIDLFLDGNEGATPPADLIEALRVAAPGVLRDYPGTGALAADLAARFGVSADRVLVTAGGDDALDRVCRAVLAPGREVVFPTPGFEMVARYARLAGGAIVEVPWPEGPFPTDAVLAAVTERTTLIVATTPQNPTGAAIAAGEIRRLCEGAPGALVLVDLAYVEFADNDPTSEALAHGNALVVRTLSKAWGLAGLRIGYAIGSPEVIRWLRVAGAPYAVAGPSVAMARARLASGEADMAAFVARIRSERATLSARLADLGMRPIPSDANFVLVDVGDALWVRDAMAGLGIAVRAFPGRPDLDGRVRIALPGEPVAFDRVLAAFDTVRRPQALLLDMDGVLADVSSSFRVAIQATCAAHGVEVTADDVAAIKREGDANNDWVVSWRLITRRGGTPTTFEALYQGTPDQPGLRRTERLIPERAVLERLKARAVLGIVTGRPRADALRFLEEHALTGLFDAVVCMEDGPLKPDPFPVREAMRRLGVSTAWMVGDTVDDARSARRAGALPLGVVAPGDARDTTAPTLVAAGAARVIESLADLEALWP